MPNRRSVVLLAAALVGGSILGPSARAAPIEKKPVAKIENALLEGLVGSWDVAVSAMGEGSGVSRVRKAAGGTALVQETRVTVGGRAFYAVSVLRVDDGGKTVKVWRTDTLGFSEMTAFHGPLGAEGFEATSEGGVVMRFAKTAAGYDATVTRGGAAVFSSKYTKAAKDVEIETPNALKDGLEPAMIGAWDVAGAWIMPGKDGAPVSNKVTGVSTFRWALGGPLILHDFERTTPRGSVSGLGVHGRAADGSSAKVWWFGNDQVDPVLFQGPATDTAWHSKGTMPDGSEMALEWSKKGDGFEMRYEVGGKPAGSETFTKKK